MHIHTRKLAVAAVAGALMVGTLAGCSSSGGGGEDEGGVTTINWWTRDGEGQKTLTEAFNESHEDIQVKLTQLPFDQFVSKVGTGVRGSNGPDVLDFDVADSPLFAATGVLADITDQVDGLDFKDALNPGMLTLGTYQDKVYSVPFNAGPSFMLYNKTLFEQAGLDPETPPSTWDEIKTAATAVAALGDDVYGFDIPGACGGGLSFTAQPYIWASGGETMTDPGPDQVTTYAESPEVAATFNFYKEMWDGGLVSPAAKTTDCATWGTEWRAGKVGIITAGAWMIEWAEESGAEVGYFPIPGQDGGISTFAGGNNDGIVASSEKQDAAWEFLTWLMSEEAQLTMSESNGSAPGRSDIITDAYSEEHPLVAFQTEIGEESNGPNSIATTALQLSASSPWLVAFQQIVFEGADPQSTLETADAESAKLIEQAYSQVSQ